MTRASLTRLAVAGAAILGAAALTVSPAVADPASKAAAPAVSNGTNHGPKHPAGHGHQPDPSVSVRLLTINDLHGNLEPPTGSGSRILDPNGPLTDTDGSLTGIAGAKYSIAGGAAYLAAHLKQLRTDNTLLVGAGDLIGASPLLSAAYHDEPTAALLDQLGLATSSAGNHEFDEGINELKRIMNGGCHPADGCSPAGTWKGTSFDYLGANVQKESNGDYALPPYFVKKINGMKVAFIGLVTQTTPSIVTASGIAGLKFTEEIAAANKVSKLLARHGVKAQVVLVHEGDGITPNQDPSSCPVVPGAGSRIAKGLDPQIDLVISGHSHQAYVCKVKDPAGQDRVYTQGSSFGRAITQIDFKIDRRTKDVIRSSVVAKNNVVTRTVTPDPDTETYINTWKERVSAVANKPIGKITATIGRGSNVGETPLGDLIADAQLEATKTGGNAEIALMNPGGVRADLTFPQSGAEGDGVVTYGEAFTVQPFNNLMQVVTLTGAQLKALLEQQIWKVDPTTGGITQRILQPSSSLTYTFDTTKPEGSRVSDIKINGTAVTDTQQIRVAANNFLVGGGDGFTVFTQSTNLWSGPLDIDALVAYMGAHSPIAPPATGRINLIR
ncbi:bifunctional metallophosphatase/5'-nucleotidase [Microbispora triticiradicis]|uniref:Bifunctional metallophosphatase/5'-nucleotidase n=1 Tax=Microbispora triticiradicis TaxID=2200763 RepID=A0ABX9LRB9_9ACTN|nr:bifunctional metallophosphatase/5'-nucleotidase [Microbispora triticiradicis]RGA06469.1 bifunctional metallophosphatase/5'-nucleotidase [Microbispora triticiradicis]GLW22259.1 bifunctional metallophosphatase/5'-nucleotidase [Microbispora amethystogenes]